MIKVTITQPHYTHFEACKGYIIQTLTKTKYTEKYPLDWIKEEYLQDRLQLWIVRENDDELLGYILTCIRQHPGDVPPYLEVFGLGGVRFSEWAKEAVKQLTKGAKEQGCTQIKETGRSAWGKIVGRYFNKYTVETVVTVEI